MNSTSRDDIRQLAEEIETLSKQVQTTLSSGGNVLGLANELARKNITFVFSLGELYANELSKKPSAKPVARVKATTVSNPNNTSRKYARDTLGRFSNKTNAV